MGIKIQRQCQPNCFRDYSTRLEQNKGQFPIIIVEFTHSILQMIFTLFVYLRKICDFFKKILIDKLRENNSIVLNVGLDFFMLDKNSGAMENYG